MLRAGLLQCLSSSCGLPLGLGSSTSSAALALQHLVLVGQQARNAATKAKGSSKKTPADAKPAKKATKKASAAADAPAKQRVLSAYQLFVKNRAVGGKGSGLLKTLAAEWKGMGEHQKAPYVNQAAVAKAQIMQVRWENCSGATTCTVSVGAIEFNLGCALAASHIPCANHPPPSTSTHPCTPTPTPSLSPTFMLPPDTGARGSQEAPQRLQHLFQGGVRQDGQGRQGVFVRG